MAGAFHNRVICLGFARCYLVCTTDCSSYCRVQEVGFQANAGVILFTIFANVTYNLKIQSSFE